MHQFMRSRFRESVLSGWDDEWRVLQIGLFEEVTIGEAEFL